jgi:hypothetical protein
MSTRAIVAEGHELVLGRIGTTHVLANDSVSPLRVVRAIATHTGTELVGDAFDKDGKPSGRGRAIHVRAQEVPSRIDTGTPRSISTSNSGLLVPSTTMGSIWGLLKSGARYDTGQV